MSTGMPRSLYEKLMGDEDPAGTWCCPTCGHPLIFNAQDDLWECPQMGVSIHWETIVRCEMVETYGLG